MRVRGLHAERMPAYRGCGIARAQRTMSIRLRRRGSLQPSSSSRPIRTLLPSARRARSNGKTSEEKSRPSSGWLQWLRELFSGLARARACWCGSSSRYWSRCWRGSRQATALRGLAADRASQRCPDPRPRSGYSSGKLAGRHRRTALGLWERGEARAALSLLYRGLLSRLVHTYQVPIRAFEHRRRLPAARRTPSAAGTRCLREPARSGLGSAPCMAAAIRTVPMCAASAAISQRCCRQRMVRRHEVARDNLHSRCDRHRRASRPGSQTGRTGTM